MFLPQKELDALQDSIHHPKWSNSKEGMNQQIEEKKITSIKNQPLQIEIDTIKVMGIPIFISKVN